jgi:hypothetical protein
MDGMGDMCDDPPYDPNAATLFDGIPNWGRTATVSAKQSGRWQNASTWNTGRVPTTGDTVLIPAGLTVTLDDKRPIARTVVVSGILRYDPARPSLLSAATVLVRPDGVLEMGTDAAPLQSTAALTLRGDAYPSAEDPALHGNGLLVLGRWVARGAFKTPFLRLAAPTAAGAAQVTLAAPATGWAVGDTVALPDSRAPYARLVTSGRPESWSETATISRISSDKRTITLSAPLRFVHAGSAAARPGETPFLPHVLNLSRNVQVTSATPNGRRGHVLAGGKASVDLQNVRFGDLGRTRIDPLDPLTNRIGRYAMHFHHCTGAFQSVAGGYRARLAGCAFDGSPKWQVAIHGTSKVRLENNAFWGAKGAAVVTEDGNERDNEIVGNIAANVPGSGELEPGLRPDKKDFGSEGTGFWLAGSANLVANNIAADCGLAGFLTFPHAADTLRYPMTAEAEHCCFAYLQLPDIDFLTLDTPYRNNEAYATRHGFELWRNSPFTLKDSRAWNCHIGLQPRYTDNLIVDGLIVRGQRTPGYEAAGWEPSMGVNNRFFPVCRSLRNLDVAGSEWGVKLQTPTGLDTTNGGFKVFDVYLENSRFACPLGVWVEGDLHYKKWLDGPSRVYLRNCRFESPDGGSTPFTSVVSNLAFGNDLNMLAGDEVWIENYQGRIGESWRLYYPIQAPNVIVPHSSLYAAVGDLSPDVDTMTYWDGTVHFRVRGLSEPGLTNAQAWEKYGKASAGSVAPTDFRHPEMSGLAQMVPYVAAPFLQPKAIWGRLDEATDRYVRGWTIDENDTSHHVAADVYVDGAKVGTTVAGDYRPDMGRRIGYRWNYPASLLDGREHTIRLVASGTSVPLPGYPVTVRTAASQP